MDKLTTRLLCRVELISMVRPLKPYKYIVTVYRWSDVLKFFLYIRMGMKLYLCNHALHWVDLIARI